MNGKKAKQLRKQAKQETIGLPEADYKVVRPNQKKSGYAQLSPKSTRGRYQQLKAAYKAK